MDRSKIDAIAARVASRDRHKTVHPGIIQEIVEDAFDAYSDLYAAQDIILVEELKDILRRALAKAQEIDRDPFSMPPNTTHGPILDILEEAAPLLEGK